MDVAIQTDGRILVVASREVSEGGFTYHLLRFNTDGTPDSTFSGGTGRVELATQANRVAVQGDGKILVLGTDIDHPLGAVGNEFVNLVTLVATGGSGSYMQVIRYNPDGTPDSPFGGNGDGSAKFDFSQNGIPAPLAVTVQADGKVVVGGSQCNLVLATYPRCDPAAARLTSTGVLDPSFNPCGQGTFPCGGVVITPIEAPGVGTVANGGSSYLSSAVVQPDGKILLAGTGGAVDGTGALLIRYNVGVAGQPDGSLDATFNPCVRAQPPCGGKQMAPAGPERYGAYSVSLEPDGKIVVAGGVGGGEASQSDFLVARYNADGTLDTCGTPGYARTYFGLSAAVSDVVVQPDGRILAGGVVRERDSESVALARYMGGGVESGAFSIGPADVRVGEPVSGQAAAAFKIRLDLPACNAVSVAYVTSDDTATDGADYQGTSGQPLRVRFEANEQEKIVQVPVLADTAVEPDERFFVDISDPRPETPPGKLDPLFPPPFAYRIDQARATASIIDAGPRISIEGSTVPEAYTGTVPVPFTVALSGLPATPVRVHYKTVDGSAVSGVDYVPKEGDLIFDPDGPTSQTVTVDVLGDTIAEVTESLKMALSLPGTDGTAVFINPNPVNVPLPAAPQGCPPLCPPDKAAPYPSNIAVTGMTGTVTDIKVTLRNLWWEKGGPSDADIMLVAPDGKAVMLMSDACGDNSNTSPISRTSPVTLTFDDQAGESLPADSVCSSGSYRPLDDDDDANEFEGLGAPRPPDVFPEAPAAPSSTLPLPFLSA